MSTLVSLIALDVGHFNLRQSHTRNERRVPELIPVLGSQPAGDRSHKPGGRLPYIPLGPQLPPQPPGITTHWLVPNYTAW